ncbi:permease prefix domain 1-containing protein [Paenibacillus lemnae]|uniref:DUF1129 domain-containing protein n=1 Tax=Paenibacillus lemnae TaxID=1330551 RepID=A0A848M645_PAELE|nr:permease prefix domain 1-containing protein [Paenibacillus lemnae]NMO95572.1 hypothetical protein [Paenibacillus lemnae]
MTTPNDLEHYVDRLFHKQRKTKAVKELKDEILSNLEAKVQDYMQEGMTYDAAVAAATRDVQSVDYLIEGHQQTDWSGFRLDLLQHSLLCMLLAWIITLPARMTFSGFVVNNLLIVLCAAAGIGYVIYVKSGRSRESQTVMVNTNALKKISRIAWALWGAAMLVTAVFTLLTRFGSNLWFGRPIHLNGPYDLYVLGMELLPTLTAILIPLVLQHAQQRISKYEVSS